MIYKQLGKWGLRLSRLGMGTHMNLGHSLDDAGARALVRTAYEGGINFFDTANTYAEGRAEEALGRCLIEYERSSYVVLSKVCGAMGTGPNDRGLSAKHIREQCDASLRRLDMDYIDIYLCHRPDPSTPLEEIVRAVDQLIASGKVLYWGVSEWPAPLIVQANAEAHRLNGRPIAVSEPRYNLLFRDHEAQLFPTTRQEGIGNVVFSPLAHGVLAGIYPPGTPPPTGTRAALEGPGSVTHEFYYNERNKERARKLGELAKAHGVTAAAMACAWCAANEDVSSVILGAWNAAEMAESLKAADYELSREVKEQIEALFPAL